MNSTVPCVRFWLWNCVVKSCYKCVTETINSRHFSSVLHVEQWVVERMRWLWRSELDGGQGWGVPASEDSACGRGSRVPANEDSACGLGWMEAANEDSAIRRCRCRGCWEESVGAAGAPLNRNITLLLLIRIRIGIIIITRCKQISRQTLGRPSVSVYSCEHRPQLAETGPFWAHYTAFRWMTSATANLDFIAWIKTQRWSYTILRIGNKETLLRLGTEVCDVFFLL